LALDPVGLFVVVAELALKHAVDPRTLLLLPALQEVLALLDPAAAVLAGRVGADLDRALGGFALRALEEQRRLLAPAALAVRSGVTRHRCRSFRSSDAPTLRRTATVVRCRGDVLDGTDLQAGGLQRADRGLATGARPLDEDVHLAHAVLHGTARGGLGGHLR